MKPRTVEPFLFGKGERALFGLYHAADEPRGDRGVVIAHPFGHEYLYAYGALRELALRLAGAGLPLLRFDYYGTGDSAGNGDDGTLELWREDLRLAMDELRESSGVERVSLAGLRLGASLAAFESAEDIVDRLVLWEPVVEGRAHVAELRRSQARFLERAFDDERDWERSRGEGPFEAIGFPVSSELVSSLERFSLLDLEGAPEETLVLTRDLASAELVAGRLRALGSRVEVERSTGPRAWDWERGVGEALIPLPALRRIESFLTT